MEALLRGVGPFLRYSLAIFWLACAVTGLLDIRGWSVMEERAR